MFAASSQPFWSNFVLQLVDHHPSVKHGMLAHAAQMQAMRCHYSLGDSQAMASAYRAQAMIHYNRGIMALASADRYAPREAILVACGLFATLEMWPQKGRAPHIHVKAGLDLGRREPPSAWTEISLKGFVLRGLLWLADVMAAYHDGASQPQGPLLVYAINPVGIPRVFTAMGPAIETVEVIIRSIMHLRNSPVDEDSWTKHRQLVALRDQISSAIDASVTTACEQLDFVEELKKLQIHLRVAHLMLQTYTAGDESVWDAHSADFKKILAGVEHALAYEKLMSADQTRKFSHRATLGYICLLFCVATKCRDNKQRRRALELLHGLQRKERSWNSCIASQIASAVVDTEDRLSQGQDRTQPIPEDCRVRLVSVSFDARGSKIIIFYHRMNSTPKASKPAIESTTMPWEPRIDHSYEFVQLSRKSLSCFGYAGVQLLVSPIECQCHPSQVKKETETSVSPPDSETSHEMPLELR